MVVLWWSKMPQVAKQLTDIQLRNLKQTGLHRIGGEVGLSLKIAASGKRTFILRAKIGEKRTDIKLGDYPPMTLAQARTKAKEHRTDISKGLDPIMERKRRSAALAAEQARYMTFKGACEEFIPMKTKTLTNRKHAAQWWSTMKQYAYPTLASVNVDDITVQDILVLLKPIWFEKPETADRVRQRIEAILGWATVNGHRSGDNPAAWRNNLQMALPSARDAKRAKNDGVERKHPMLAVSDIPSWFNDMKARGGGASQCLCFMAMTTARSDTARSVKWEQIDLERGVWTVPAPNMKTKKDQVYPLGKVALEFLTNYKNSFAKEPASDMWVFPSPTGRVLSDTSLSNLMKAVHAAADERYIDPLQKRRAVPHGLRATFKTWATEIGFDSDMSEIQLAHQVGDAVFRSYMRTDMVERRREMMARWEAFINDPF